MTPPPIYVIYDFLKIVNNTIKGEVRRNILIESNSFASAGLAAWQVEKWN